LAMTTVAALVAPAQVAGAAPVAPTFDRRTLQVSGDATPFLGYFNKDDTTDIFWLGDGTKPDAMWFGVPGQRGRFTKVNLRFDGHYRVIVGQFASDGVNDILLWGLGSAPDLYLQPNGGKTVFDVSKVDIPYGGLTSAIVLTDYDAWDDILFFGFGSLPDQVWHFSDTGSGEYAIKNTRIDTTRGYVLNGYFNDDGLQDLFIYGQGSAPDALWLGRSDGNFTKRSMSVGGAFVPTAFPRPNGLSGIYWSAYGGHPDQLWRATSSGGFKNTKTATYNESGNVNANGVPQPASAFEWALGHLVLFSREFATEDLVDNGSSDNSVEMYKGLNHPADTKNNGYSGLGNADFDGDGNGDILWFHAGAPPDEVDYGLTAATASKQRPTRGSLGRGSLGG